MRNPCENLEAAISARWQCDPNTGQFYKDGKLYTVKPTVIKGRSYVHLYISGKKVRAHRLMWYLSYGRWPTHDIDHINGNSLDNRLVNLRDVPNSINAKNKPSRSSRSLPKGVYRRGKKFSATAWDNSREIFGKHRDTLREAICDRVEMLQELGFTHLHIKSSLMVDGELHAEAVEVVRRLEACTK